MRHKSYETMVVGTYILFAISILIMYVNNDLKWLWLMPVIGMVNHFFFSLNHRLISHKSFVAKNELVHKLIISLSIFQIMHSPFRFAVMHRHHHAHADVPGKDIHGPTKGFWTSVFTWDFNLNIAELGIKLPKDLMRDKFLLWYDKHYYKILALTGLIIYLIDWKLFWYIFIPGAIWFRITAGLLTNYYLSYFGYTNYDLGTDTAKNSFLVNIFTFGEGWHNNHHAQPGNYRIGHKWWEWDPTAFIITHFLKK